MKKFINRLFVFIVLFAVIIGLNQETSTQAAEIDSDNPDIIEVIEDLRFYSSYNYQSLNQDKLNQLIVDFYVPTSYGETLITWELNSNFLELSQIPEVIEVQTVNGMVSVDVLKVTILSEPNVFQGDQLFELTATFSLDNDTEIYTYVGSLVPSIPSDFLGGAVYIIMRYGGMFLEGALYTVSLSLIGTMIGFVLALAIVTAKTMTINDYDSRFIKILKNIAKKLASLYITVFRGTPMIVQASFFWYGLGLFGDALLCGLFVVSLNTAAYIAEIIRGGINGIDKGQFEAASSLGLSKTQTMMQIIFPQAIKNSLPAIGNEFVINIKDTAVLSVIGIFELFNQTRKIAGMHYRQLETYLIVALIYLFLTYTVTSVLRHIEKRMDMPLKDLPSSN